MVPVEWLARRDRDLAALRRAARAAIVMPAMFAIGDKVIGNPTVATFAAFGSFAMLLLVDFGGPMRVRLQARRRCVVGAVLVCTRHAGLPLDRWLAALAMALVAFAVLFAGVVSSVLASATTSLLLAFILPVSLAGPPRRSPTGVAGWGMAAGGGADRHRRYCGRRRYATRSAARPWRPAGRWPRACARTSPMRSASASDRGGRSRRRGGAAPTRRSQALRQAFFATPYRPTGLSTATRMIVRLVDELRWLNAIVVASAPRPGSPATSRACARSAPRRRPCSTAGADAARAAGGTADAADARRAICTAALAALEQGATVALPIARLAGRARRPTAAATRPPDSSRRSNRASAPRSSTFAVSQLAANIELAAAAEQRSWLARLLGRQPAGLAGRSPGGRRSAPAPTSTAIRSGCTTACAARSPWASPCWWPS